MNKEDKTPEQIDNMFFAYLIIGMTALVLLGSIIMLFQTCLDSHKLV